MITLGLGLFGVLWAMTRLATTAFDADVAGYLIGGVALIGVFVLIERAAGPSRCCRCRIFRVPTMTASLLASLFQGLASFAVLFLVHHVPAGAARPVAHPRLAAAGPRLRARSVVGPYAGRLADRRGPVLPATAGLAIQVVSLAIYAQLAHDHRPVGGRAGQHWSTASGPSFFFPANSSAIMKAAPPESFGIASGMLRTFANIGMVFSFAVAILIASRSISRGLAFAIFVGNTSLHGNAFPRLTAPRRNFRFIALP